jgi:hypothetical protein
MEMEDGLGVSFFFKALIVDGGEGRGLYFFTFFTFMFLIFWDLLLLKEGGKVGCGAFFIKKSNFVVSFFDCV